MKLSNAFLREVLFKRQSYATEQGHPWDLPILRKLDRLPLDPGVTFFVGENGTGKSTILEAIAVAAGFNAEGGSFSANFSTRESHSPLHQHLTLIRGTQRPKTGFFLRAESLYTLSTYVEQDSFILHWHGGKSFHTMSHGEAFLALLRVKFRDKGLYFLDEPESALSPLRQMACLSVIHRLVQAGAQLIIATHSPILMACPGARIYLFTQDGIQETSYEDTEHVQVARRFFAHMPAVLEELLAGEDEED